MQTPSNTASNNNNNNLNPTVSAQERNIIIENIKKFLIEHLPADQVTSPQKAHELAVRFENHVAMSTSTKEQYQGMIAEKLRMIKSKSVESAPISTLQSQMHNSNNSNTNNNVAANSLSANTINLTPQEMVQISTRLHQIRPQIPQIDKLLLLHSKLPVPPSNTLEMVKKLTDCRNVLVNQIESSQLKRSFLMNLSQLNLLIEQVQRLFNSLVAKMKESAGVSPTLTTTTGKTTMSTLTTATTANIANTNTNTSSAISLSSASINSSGSSIISIGKGVKLNKSQTTATNNTSEFEKILLQRLALPSYEHFQNNSPPSNWLNRFVSFNSSRKPNYCKPTSLKHLKQRNYLLNCELKRLQSQTSARTVKIEENGLGILSVLLTCKGHRFIFQISQKYPYDQLIYKIEALNGNHCQSEPFLLPSHLEPKTFPLTITTIVKNFKE